MKIIASLLFILSVSFSSYGQSHYLPNEETGVAVGLTGGYSSKKSFIGNFSLGAMIKGKSHISINLQGFSDPSAVNVPIIGEGRIGHMLGTVEVYAGYGYHYAGNEYDYKQGYLQFRNGFRPAYGVVKHFDNSMWTVGAGMSGKIFSLQIGILVIR